MIDNIFGIAGSALNAQLTRMNATASNLANAGNVATEEKDAFRAKRLVFQTLVEQQKAQHLEPLQGGVRVANIVNDPTPVQKQYEPGNPMADKDGFVFHSNVNEVTEMVEMMAAARSYQNNVEMVNTTRQLMLRTLEITRS